MIGMDYLVSKFHHVYVQENVLIRLQCNMNHDIEKHLDLDLLCVIVEHIV